MKTARNMFIAFILNLSFSMFEFIGGMVVGSAAIASDAVHDLGDAASIGLSYFLERKSHKPPNETHTYGYARYAVMGGCITTLVLFVGSVLMIVKSVGRIFSPTAIDYDGMITFAVVGFCVNFLAALVTRAGDSLNQKAVNLHMLEDVLGWVIVLIGAVVMRFTNAAILDPLMCIGVSLFILINTIATLKETLSPLLEKAPRDSKVTEIKKHIEEIDGVLDVHHIHVWSIDEKNHLATMHVVTDGQPPQMKAKIREALRENGIAHVTVELETSTEHCHEKQCDMGGIHSCCGCGHAHHSLPFAKNIVK